MDCTLWRTGFCIFLLTTTPLTWAEVVWAVNCGGPTHIDVHGIEYIADPLLQGTASEYGRQLVINRVRMEDQILFQTERFHTDHFSYDLPYLGDGSYVLTLGFSEVWFAEPNQKVFDVQLNKEITLLQDLDIFSEVGFATGLVYDFPFRIADGVLHVGESSTSISRDSITLNFLRTGRDNPKINMIRIIRGTLEDLRAIVPSDLLSAPEPKEQRHIPKFEPEPQPRKRPAGSPRVPDPYENTDLSYWLLPILGSVAAFLPILFCLCRI
ncbi:hypothetical protein CRM22_000907 [Opisthorchis felineus]|uniref:Malectin domain-containing protein n=1 Tax=Opisthorchis felineus TaxID=147828 RepID=A0A4S2MJ33_OPIFE|nr:hypothetical protein CRM22_000907 [Opisthorchis felineus]